MARRLLSPAAACSDALAQARAPLGSRVPVRQRCYRKALEANGLVCSTSRKGNCWNNAVAESFFATLKGYLVDHAEFAARVGPERDL